jgi:hypothetical protein
MRVIPTVSYVKTAAVEVGEFVLGVEKGRDNQIPLAIRSEIDKPIGNVPRDFVIRLDGGPKIEPLEAHESCLFLSADLDLSWRLGADRIETADDVAVGAVAVLSDGPYLVIQRFDTGRKILAIMLNLGTGKCTTMEWGRSQPTMPWSIVDGNDHEYARWPAPNGEAR